MYNFQITCLQNFMHTFFNEGSELFLNTYPTFKFLLSLDNNQLYQSKLQECH